MNTQTPAAHKDAFRLVSDETINRKNFKRIPLDYSPDGEIITPNGTFKGIEKIADFYRDHHIRYPDSHFLLNHVVAEGDWVAAFCTFTATQTIRPEGLPAFRMPLRIPVAIFSRFEGNRIANQTFVWDNEDPRRKAWLATVASQQDYDRSERIRNQQAAERGYFRLIGDAIGLQETRMNTQTPAAHKDAFRLVSDEAINRKNPKRILLDYSPDGEILTPNGTFNGIDAITTFHQDQHRRYPDLPFRLNQVVAEDSVVAALCTFTATQTIRPKGLPAFRMPLRIPVAVFSRFEGSRIVNQTFVWDNEGPRRKAWLATVASQHMPRNDRETTGSSRCGE